MLRANVLYRQADAAPAPLLVAELRARGFTPSDLPEDAAARDDTAGDFATPSPHHARWHGPAGQITITTRHSPHPAADFQGALNAPWLGAHRGFLSNMVQHHRASVTLAFAPNDAQGDALAHLRLLHRLIAAQARDSAPMGLFWAPPTQLLSGAQYNALIDDPQPLALFVHPRPKRVGHDSAGRILTQLDLPEAAALIGHHVRVAPSPLPRADLLQLAWGFVAHCLASDVLPESGRLLHLKKNLTIEVQRDLASGGFVLQPRAGRPHTRIGRSKRARAGAPVGRAAAAVFGAAGIVALALAAWPALTASDMATSASLDAGVITIRKID